MPCTQKQYAHKNRQAKNPEILSVCPYTPFSPPFLRSSPPFFSLFPPFFSPFFAAPTLCSPEYNVAESEDRAKLIIKRSKKNRARAWAQGMTLFIRFFRYL